MGNQARANPNNPVDLTERRRHHAVLQASKTLRVQLHAMLDAHLDQIMPELLADVSVGMGVTVGVQTTPPPSAEDLDPNAEAILAQRTGVLNEQGQEVLKEPDAAR